MAGSLAQPGAPGRFDPARVDSAVSALEDAFGSRLSRAEPVRRQHANSLTWHPAQLPDAVVFAECADDVRRVLAICTEHRCPVVAFGAGTGVEGQINAPFGGISLNLSRMNRVLAVRQGDLDCTVEPGVTHRALNVHLRDTGLFFPVDPGADASLGGMAATRASGTMTVRYGSMRENVISLDAVASDGSLVRTEGRARKSAAGFDLTRLFLGSEGVLGIIVGLTLRLWGRPESILAGVCGFPDIRSACEASIAAIQTGLAPARIELLDEWQMRASSAHSGLGLPSAPHLFVEFHGSHLSTAAQAEAFADLARDHGGQHPEFSADHAVQARLWRARHDAFWAMKTFWPGREVLVTDACVPLSALAECIDRTRADMDRHGLEGPIAGHVGDGNFHAGVCVDPTDPDARTAALSFADRLARRAIAMEGTCTGEHGVGMGKIAYAAEERASGLRLSQALKTAFDPLGILNPGKMLPDEA